ncbi:MAG: hypothetical protein AB7O50_15850 [Pseudolabrys sp.]
MRSLFLALAATLMFAPAEAAPQRAAPFQSLAEVTDWINTYRDRRDAARTGEAIKAASRFGGFKDPEQAGVYVGFIAGILGANRDRADRIVASMFPLSESDHWAVVRGIAYSGLPNWRFVLKRAAHRMPSRRVMIEAYTGGKLPILGDLKIEPSPTTWQRVKASLSFGNSKPVKPDLEPNQVLLDTLWGYYLATGSYGPLLRIVELLPWAGDRDDVEKLTVGSMAKYTLAVNASRDPALLDQLRVVRRAKAKHDSDSTKPLDEVIAAAETADTGKLRKDQLAAIEQLKMKGPGYKRDLSTWGKIGQGAIAVGCVAAAATGQVQFGLPCVIGGGATSAALYYMNDSK